MKHTPKLFTMAIGAALFAMSTIMISCDKSSDAALSSEAGVTANNEATQDAQQDEVDDMANNAMGNADSPTSRTEGRFIFEDYRCSCAVITHEADTVKGQGNVTIDFGTGCTDKYGNTRKGKIMINWTGGRWFVAGSIHVITFSGYSVNDVSFSDSDVRTVTNVSTNDHPLLFNIVAQHSLTWPDQTTASRAVHKTREWIRTATIVDDKVIVSQTSTDVPAAVGTNRHGIAYSTAITVPLEYDRSCMIANRVFKPVSGTKVITYDTNKIVTIDYGNGSCDRTFTVTADGVTRTYHAKNDSSND